MKWNLTIVTPCYNEEERIVPLLKSIQAQTVKPEVVFVDGGSTDRTVEIIRSFMKRNKNIKLLFETGKRSPANARNIGIKAATGNLFIILNADAMLERDYTKKIIRAFEKNPDADQVLFRQEPIVPNNLGFFQKAVFFRDEAYGYATAGRYAGAMKTALQKKAGFYNKELGFGEDRYIQRHGFEKLKYKNVFVKQKLKMSLTSYPTPKGFFTRCLWYGRTIPRYLKKEKEPPIIFYYLMSILTIPLILFFWMFTILSIILAVILFLVLVYGIYKVMKILRLGYCSKSFFIIPVLEIAELIGIGLGFFQYLFGNRTIGR